MMNNDATSPLIVRGVEQAAVTLEKVISMPLPVTREDDWSLTRALAALHEVIAANQMQPGAR